MRALRLIEWQKRPEFVEVPTPEPGRGQVLIKVGGTGACHSDLHIMEWPDGTLAWDVPFPLGHETAGWVEQVGPGVEGFASGDPILVYGPWGCGRCGRCRLGHLAVQILKALSPARVIAVDVVQDKLELARESGADDVVLSDDQAAETIRGLTHGQGADVVLDFVGVDATLALSAKVARVLGHLTVVGLAGGSLRWDFSALPNECQLTGPYWGSITELMEVVDLARAGKIQIHTEFFPLEGAMEAYERMRSGTLRGRAVIAPHGRPGEPGRSGNIT